MLSGGKLPAATSVGAVPWLGVLYMTAAVMLQPINQAVGKYVSADLPVVEIVWWRLLFHSLLALPFVLASLGVRGMRAPNMGMQVVRGALFCAATVFLFAALSFMPMADAIAIAFIAPLVVTALSPLILGETVGPKRWAAVAIGFAGALVVIRPGSGALGWAAMFALSSGICYGLYLLITRRISGKAPLAVTLVYTSLIGFIIMSLMLPFIWKTPTLSAVGLMAISGVASALSHFCVIRAYRHAEASLLAPISFGEIVMATVFGYFIFGDFPDAMTWLGVVIIASTGIYVSLAGRRASG